MKSLSIRNPIPGHVQLVKLRIIRNRLDLMVLTTGSSMAHGFSKPRINMGTMW
jgi:hypothetical protein